MSSEQSEYRVLKIVLARPQAYLLTIDGLLGVDKKKVATWKWVQLAELMEYLAVILETGTESGFPSGHSLLRQFAPLNRNWGKGLVTWASYGGCRFFSADMSELLPCDVYIPEGWSDSIIAMAKKGVMKVIPLPPETAHGAATHDLQAEFYDGRKVRLYCRGKGGYMFADNGETC